MSGITAPSGAIGRGWPPQRSSSALSLRQGAFNVPSALGALATLPGDFLPNLVAGHIVTNLSLATFGADGETCGGKRWSGAVENIAVGALDILWVLAPNGDSVNQATAGNVTSNKGIVLRRTAAGVVESFRFVVTCLSTKTGANRTFAVKVIMTDGTVLNSTATWTDSTTPMWFERLKAINAADGSTISTVGTLAATISATGAPTQMSCEALGL